MRLGKGEDKRKQASVRCLRISRVIAQPKLGTCWFMWQLLIRLDSCNPFKM